jgi:hypothetical protein
MLPLKPIAWVLGGEGGGVIWNLVRAKETHWLESQPGAYTRFTFHWSRLSTCGRQKDCREPIRCAHTIRNISSASLNVKFG